MRLFIRMLLSALVALILVASGIQLGLVQICRPAVANDNVMEQPVEGWPSGFV